MFYIKIYGTGILQRVSRSPSIKKPSRLLVTVRQDIRFFSRVQLLSVMTEWAQIQGKQIQSPLFFLKKDDVWFYSVKWQKVFYLLNVVHVAIPALIIFSCYIYVCNSKVIRQHSLEVPLKTRSGKATSPQMFGVPKKLRLTKSNFRMTLYNLKFSFEKFCSPGLIYKTYIVVMIKSARIGH